MATNPIVRGPGEGRLIPGPEGIRLKATGPETAGSIGVLEATSGPGFAAPPHIHHSADELFYVLEGEFQFLLGDKLYAAQPGSFVFIPRGTVHSPQVTGTQPGRAVVAFVPGGQELAFEEFGALATGDGPPDEAAIQAVARKFNSEFV